MSRIRFLLASIVVVAACAEDPVGPPEQTFVPSLEVAAATATAVMTGLNSPRGLSFGPEGALYVTEAGTTQINGACTQFLEGNVPSTKCYSGTGSVSRLSGGTQTRFATGLPSTYIVQSGFASGPQDISFNGRGHAMVAVGWGGSPALRSELGAGGEASGSVIKVQPSGEWKVVGDVSGFEESDNPAGGVVDSNPYGVLAEPGRTFVVDAGGNSLVEVAANGDVSLVAIFPATPVPFPFNQADAVPTRVKRGPDGALYVSTLSGAPFLAGTAVIYRVEPGESPSVYLGGFKTITDFAFAPDGGVYVLQYATSPVFFGGTGALILVAPSGARTTVTTSLLQPTGIVVGPDGSLYVSNKGTSVGTGEVLRITP